MFQDLKHILLLTTGYPANTRHSPNAGPMLGQRRRRWINIGPALDQSIVFSGLYRCLQKTQNVYCSRHQCSNGYHADEAQIFCPVSNFPAAQDVDTMLAQCWTSVVDSGPALNQHCVNTLYVV